MNFVSPDRMPIKHFFSNLGQIFRNSFKRFSDDKVLKLSGSLAYTMVFSMGPLILIIITTSSFFFGREAIEGRIYGQLEGFLGRDTALQLQDIIKHAAISGKSTLATVIGIIFLFIGATGIFSEIQDSINMIWGLKPKPKKGMGCLFKKPFIIVFRHHRAGVFITRLTGYFSPGRSFWESSENIILRYIHYFTLHHQSPDEHRHLRFYFCGHL